jgi:hypothetical protein
MQSRGGSRPSLTIGDALSRIERAQGMPGEGLTHGPPATKNAGGSHHRFSRSSGIPRATVLTLIRDLPGDRLSCPRRPQCSSTKHRELGISTGMPGPHDFTSATTPLVWQHRQRPPHPRLTYRDDRAYAPQLEAGCADTITISEKKKAVYFSREGWTGRVRLIALMKIAFSRKVSAPVSRLRDHIGTDRPAASANGCLALLRHER